MLAKNESWLQSVTGYGRVTIEPLAWLPLEYLCFNLRPIDKEEIFDNLPDSNPLALAASIHQAVAKRGCGWIARLNGRPAACMGVFENFPGNWQVFSFGTQNYRRVLVAFKPKLDLLVAYARNHGMHRLECKSLKGHSDAHRTIRFLGMGNPLELKAYGAKRQDYVYFSRVWEKNEPPVGDDQAAQGSLGQQMTVTGVTAPASPPLIAQNTASEITAADTSTEKC